MRSVEEVTLDKVSAEGCSGGSTQLSLDERKQKGDKADTVTNKKESKKGDT